MYLEISQSSSYKTSYLVKEVQTELFILLDTIHLQPSVGSELHRFENIVGKKFNARIVDFQIFLHHSCLRA